MKNWFSILLLAGLLALTGCANHLTDNNTNPWEYKTVMVHAVSQGDFRNQILPYANQGWQVITIQGTGVNEIVTMKRARQ